MDKALAHGAGDCRFESCRGHLCQSPAARKAGMAIAARVLELRQECRDVSATNRSHGPCGLMDKALVFGAKDCRLEPCQGQRISLAHTRAV